MDVKSNNSDKYTKKSEKIVHKNENVKRKINVYNTKM